MTKRIKRIISGTGRLMDFASSYNKIIVVSHMNLRRRMTDGEALNRDMACLRDDMREVEVSGVLLPDDNKQKRCITRP